MANVTSITEQILAALPPVDFGVEKHWNDLRASVPLDERMFYLVGTVLIHTVVFYGTNLIFYIMRKNNMLAKYRIQGNKEPPQELVNKAYRHVIFDSFIVFPVLLYFIYEPVIKAFGGLSDSTPFPSFWVGLAQVLTLFALEDTFFYWAHRLLHWRVIYKYIHKQHHEFKVNVGIGAEYANPIEAVVSNVIPTFGGAMLLGAHNIVFWTFFICRMAETVDSHSGYDLPYPLGFLNFIRGGSDRHDFHHSKNVGSYGSFTKFWDYVCGTDAKYKEWKEAQTKGKKAQ
eukprot:Colp12_sorted_trinity150504_noHs@29580